MKKAISLISACVLILSLSACGSQPQESTIHSSKEVEADTLSTEQEPVQEELSGDKLTALFEEVYTSVHDTLGADTSDEERVQWEVKSFNLFIGDNEKLPADYEAQYKAWRAANITEDEEQAQSDPQDLEEVSETNSSTPSTTQSTSTPSGGSSSSSSGGMPDFSDLGEKPDYTGKSGTEGCIDTTGYTSGANDPDYALPPGWGFSSSAPSSQSQGSTPDFSDLGEKPDYLDGGGPHYDLSGYTTQADELPPGFGFSG